MQGNYRYNLNQNSELFGFYCTGISARIPSEDKYLYSDHIYLDVGFGIKPSNTGMGLGGIFVRSVLEDIKIREGISKYRLSVAGFNIRAIKYYRKIGFSEKASFFNLEGNSFILMTKEVL